MNSKNEKVNTNNFKEELSIAEKLIQEEKFEQALNLLEKMKNYDDDVFDDALAHNFFMLYSNTQSIVRGKNIYQNLLSLSKIKEKASYKEIFEYLKDKNINLDIDTIKREIELLILKGIVSWKSNNNIIFFVK
ncbi:MAG: hypothetical protein KAX10_09570 [Candidatus Lokiarchaeota archaeon]|nr:hypothetical protein [Candidatus Lokiarchaeota archaeon]